MTLSFEPGDLVLVRSLDVRATVRVSCELARRALVQREGSLVVDDRAYDDLLKLDLTSLTREASS